MKIEPVKFLLVDDTPENLVALEALLRRDGLEILRARSAREALELLLVHDVALAFLDVQMPEMDGFELAELMRGTERTKHVPIIFVTARARDPQRVFKGYESGAVDFLYKPIEPHVLKGKADVFFALYKQKRELAHALRLNEMFVGVLGHDLRNPLSAMLTGAQVLEHSLSDEKQLRTLRRMTSAGQRMTDMIDQLLDLTRARLAGGLGFVRTRKPVDVAQLVQRTVDELRGAHPERDILVETQGLSRTSADSDRLLQMFSNLVSNALHHGQAGSGVAIEVDGTQRDIAVRISNRGGIPPQLLPTIFDPFRGRHAEAKKSHGLGLGLFISQQIALAHDGDIQVESDERTGTTFTVRIPRRLPDEPHDTATPRSVLVVDDDGDIRDSLREAFEHAGYRTISAANGSEALALLTKGSPRPDVVVLDLVLPATDGGVYRAMRADPSLATIPVIVCTSNSAGAPPGVIVLPKPLKVGNLLAAVASLWKEDASAGGSVSV